MNTNSINWKWELLKRELSTPFKHNMHWKSYKFSQAEKAIAKQVQHCQGLAMLCYVSGLLMNRDAIPSQCSIVNGSTGIVVVVALSNCIGRRPLLSQDCIYLTIAIILVWLQNSSYPWWSKQIPNLMSKIVPTPNLWSLAIKTSLSWYLLGILYPGRF